MFNIIAILFTQKCPKIVSNKMVSIIIPVYNVGKYFEECIESILKQTCSDWELILIDDGSTDGTREKCDSYSRLDKRIKTIYSNRGGVSKARNLGIDTAKGDFLLLLTMMIIGKKIHC